jgi:AraC-like DNA-binding protein/ligand-binding sensor protein
MAAAAAVPSKRFPPGAPALVHAIGASELYRDYERAFHEATGLPLLVREVGTGVFVRPREAVENPFCALMAGHNRACAACHAVQRQLEQQAQLRPWTVRCFAGLYETAVPIRIGSNLVAFLQTGQVLARKPNRREFSRVAEALIEFGNGVDLKRAEEAWFATRVLGEAQYDGFVRLLAVFARHLEVCGNVLALRQKESEPPAVRRARAYVTENCENDLSLPEVARFVNLSAHYFSERFKKSTGFSFTEYVARVRVEKARHLLHNPNLRVGEIAFDVGFQSLSQFNRTFRQVVGQAPTDFRRAVSRF